MRPAARGFTLLEMLLAIAIVASLSALAATGFTQLVRAQTVGSEQGARLAQLQRLSIQLVRDLSQADARPVREGYHGSLEAALLGGDAPLLGLTHAGWRNPVGAPRGSLQRVEYLLEGRALQRRAWPVLDRAPDSAPVARTLIDRVQRAEVEFLGADGWTPSWPPAGAAPEALPRAVRVRLELEDLGDIERLVELPGGLR